jgi:hypothetical protein
MYLGRCLHDVQTPAQQIQSTHPKRSQFTPPEPGVGKHPREQRVRAAGRSQASHLLGHVKK